MDPEPDCTIVVPMSHRDGRCIFRLHTQCLAARSAFLGGLLSGVSSPDLFPPLPRSHLPHLLPSPPSHPVLFLPVPDPSSIHLLFHWIYSGSTLHLQNALDHGHIQWQGLARNVEYLDLPTDIKVFLGRWYRHWFLPSRSHPNHPDIDSECGDSMSDGYYHSSSDDDLQSDDESDRGRSRSVKPLPHLCKQFRLCTT